ncbi:hypothetical protein [Niastella populi]|uniref:Alkyl hydroperoxide reductase subunit C/ Thiol specific antioxidant domain-containing protein n=1 Tax=Niastella populi TaxID=550983 RepID=A0A1V9FN90_9BACT|nr:hypothetical protein [Niastella populi]OQP59829.1 hypothetical protein A4R26_20810 [Niastella populi]
MNLKRIAIFVLMTLVFCQCRNESNPAGLAYYANLKSTLETEYNISIGNEKNMVVFVLHSDTICSCNGKNVSMVDEIARKHPDYKTVVILKNDFTNKIRDMIHTGNVTFCSDTTKVLEKNGNVFRFDKLFSVRNGAYDNMFDLEDKDVRQIRDYFNL